jgi:hypothetical protein
VVARVCAWVYVICETGLSEPKFRCAEREARSPASFLAPPAFVSISPKSASQKARVDGKGAENQNDASTGALGTKKRVLQKNHNHVASGSQGNSGRLSSRRLMKAAMVISFPVLRVLRRAADCASGVVADLRIDDAITEPPIYTIRPIRAFLACAPAGISSHARLVDAVPEDHLEHSQTHSHESFIYRNYGFIRK